MPKPSQEVSRQRDSTPNRNQPSRSISTDSQATPTVRFQNTSNEKRNNSGRDINPRGANRLNSTLNRPNSKQISSKNPANIVNVTITPRTNVKRVLSVEKLDTSAMSAEVTLQNNLN